MITLILVVKSSFISIIGSDDFLFSSFNIMIVERWRFTVEIVQRIIR